MENTRIIPLNIFQTWHTKNLEPGMKETVNMVKTQNPEFNHQLYDDDDCRVFINQYFGKEGLETYNNLIPGAYKADFWRYCILFIKGGIYLDIKYYGINCKLINLTDKEYFVQDRPGRWLPGKIGIYNALMISEAKNPMLLECIIQVIDNVKNNFYGVNALYPTGPGLMGLHFDANYKFDLEFSLCGSYIKYKNGRNIFQTYKEYREEQARTQICPYYATLWNKKLIYRNHLMALKVDTKLLLDIIFLKNINTNIPFSLYQLNYEPTLAKNISIRIENVKKYNIGLTHYLYSIYDCGEFIRKNYDYKIFNAFTAIKSNKLKIELWKYCLLHKSGGIFVDIHFNITEAFRLLNYTFKNFYVINKTTNIVSNDVIISEAKNERIMRCINKIVANVANKNYDSDWVSATNILSTTFSDEEKSRIEFTMQNNKIYHDELVIVNGIDDEYNEHVEEVKKMWTDKNFY